MFIIKINQLRLTFIGLALIALLVGCSSPAPEAVATAPPQPTNTPIQIAGVHIPDLQLGEQAWQEQQCDACHGPLGLGGIGPMLASTTLDYEEFLHIVRTAVPPKPAYTVEMLPDDVVYDIYAWLRTQLPYGQPLVPTALPGYQTPSTEDFMGMTIWSAGHCDSCHGVFAQGGPKAPVLAGLTYPVEEELARMRGAADKISEHRPDNISDETFSRLYKWLQAGCSYTQDCSQ